MYHRPPLCQVIPKIMNENHTIVVTFNVNEAIRPNSSPDFDNPCNEMETYPGSCTLSGFSFTLNSPSSKVTFCRLGNFLPPYFSCSVWKEIRAFPWGRKPLSVISIVCGFEK